VNRDPDVLKSGKDSTVTHRRYRRRNLPTQLSILSRRVYGIDVYTEPETCDKTVVSTRELIEREVAGLPEFLQRQVYDFIRFLRSKKESEAFNGLLLSKSALAKDWDTPEEDAAWASL
jgi:hypothetical protein